MIELRGRLLICVIAFILGFILCFAFAEPLYIFLVKPFAVAAAFHQSLAPGTHVSPLDLILGTAGLTAAMCVNSLIQHEIPTDPGNVLVTGASGGVGSFALSLLKRAGFHPVAVTGKPSAALRLVELGAREVIGRDELEDDSKKPLLKARWSAAIDTVGGSILSNVIRSIQPNGCVAACGNAGGAELDLTVFPFILRGITLDGIDSAWYPIEKRTTLWQKLATDWKLTDLDSRAEIIPLEHVQETVNAMLKGEHQERTIIQIGAE